MKTVLLGLIAVAFINVTMAAPSDNGGNKDMENETNKAQLDMILAQFKEIHVQLKDQQRRDEDQQKQLQEQQHQMREQQHQMSEQQYQMSEQQYQMEEVTKINRNRRSENDTVQHLKELVLAEIKPMIDGLSQCVVGSYKWDVPQVLDTDASEKKTISFGHTFSRTPTVIASLAGYQKWSRDQHHMYSTVKSPTTTKFDLEMYVHQEFAQWIIFNWIACA